jgi:hypothetical protein
MAPSPAEVEAGGQRLKGLKDTELKMAAEIATEIAKGRSGSFNVRATALMLCRAALVDQAFRARLAEVPARSRPGCWRRLRRSSGTWSATPRGSWIRIREKPRR